MPRRSASAQRPIERPTARRATLPVALALALSLIVPAVQGGCGRIGFDPLGAVDAGADGGAAADAGTLDAGARDSGSFDAGALDAGAGADAGSDGGSDAGALDAGAGADAGTDGGSDAGAADAGAGADAGALVCPPGLGCITDAFGASEYCLCTATRNWVSARAGCMGVGLDLARIDSLEEETFLTMRIAFRRYWIGATDAVTEGDFVWVDGTLFWTGGPTGAAVGELYAHWLPGQPSDLGGSGVGDCAFVETTGGWQDDICDSVRVNRVVCER